MTKWKDNNLLRESFVLKVGSAIYRPFTGKMTLDNYAYASLIRLKRDPAKTPQEIRSLTLQIVVNFGSQSSLNCKTLNMKTTFTWFEG